MADTLSYKRKSRALGFFFTSLVSGGILLILLLIIFHTPIPPFPEGGGGVGDGIELNLGFSEAGMGNNPQDLSAAPEITPPQPETKVQEEKILTQDLEDAPSIVEKPVKTKKIKKVVPKVVETPKKVVKKEPEKPQPVVNTKALYTRKNNTSSDGTSSKSGDQGDPNGTLGAKAFGGKAGSGGSGGGTGGGVGTGAGSGSGPSASVNLRERNPVLPPPEYKQQVEGVVVVEVTVDKDGKVTQAVAGVKGSTTLEPGLLEAARKAASKASFDKKPDAPAFQKGTITYRFRLQ